METEIANDIERVDDLEEIENVERADPERDVERDSCTLVPSRGPAGVVGVIAAAALSLLGVAGGSTPADAAVAPMDEALPPPEAVAPAKTARTKSSKRISPLRN
jgi:hypothetical protein